MAWPPNLATKPGCRVATSAMASRMCKPGIDRADPFSSSGPEPASANANGPAVVSFTQTPGDEAHHAFVANTAGIRTAQRRPSSPRILHQSGRISTHFCLYLRRATLSSSARAPTCAPAPDPPPAGIGCRRPYPANGQLRSNGAPMERPRSPASSFGNARLATSTRAWMPGRVRPARMRRSCLDAPGMRLLRSNGTTSATVPIATRSSQSAKRGSTMPYAFEVASVAQGHAQCHHHVVGDADAG